MFKSLPQQYHKTCTACKAHVNVRVDSRIATWFVSHQREGQTVVSLTQRKGRQGDRWGLKSSVHWMCPKCGKVHTDQFFDPMPNKSFFEEYGW